MRIREGYIEDQKIPTEYVSVNQKNFKIFINVNQVWCFCFK